MATERDSKSGAIVIHLGRDQEGGPAAVASRGRGSEASSDRLRPQERDWSSERVFTVRLRVPTGAREIDPRGFDAEETARVIQRAVDRAYPFLEREGLRNNFLYSARGKALDIQVVIPQKLGWTPNQLRSPQFQQRFMTGFHHALGQVAPSRISPIRAPGVPGLMRGAVAAREAPQILRRAEDDPERAAKDLSRAVFSKLSEALPKPFRLMRDLGRTLSRFVPRG